MIESAETSECFACFDDSGLQYVEFARRNDAVMALEAFEAMIPLGFG